MSTDHFYTDGTPIMVGDTIADQNGIEVLVFIKNRKFRVAPANDVTYGMSMSLGLFVIGGVKKVEHDGSKNVPNKLS